MERALKLLDLLKTEALPKQGVEEEFLHPVLHKHRFSFEAGKLDLRNNETYFSQVVSLLPTAEHAETYFAILEEKIRNHCARVSVNKQVCFSYATPEFDRKQAQAFATDAFIEAFRRTRSSYDGMTSAQSLDVSE